MKRTWITLKRGILEPKHRIALGELVWLYIYILDLANWEEGAVLEWDDKNAAEEMEMPLATLRDQRRKLEAKGYVSSERKQHGIRLVIHNWTNPREYSGKKYNVKVPSDTPSYTPSYTPSDTPSDTSSEENCAPSFISKDNNQKSINLPKKKSSELYQIARALSDVCGLDFEKNRERIFKMANKFKPGEEQQIIRDYGIGGIWYQADWRGKLNQKPTMSQVVETWNNLSIAVGKRNESDDVISNAVKRYGVVLNG